MNTETNGFEQTKGQKGWNSWDAQQDIVYCTIEGMKIL